MVLSMAVPRVTYALAQGEMSAEERPHWLLAALGRLHPRFGSPANAGRAELFMADIRPSEISNILRDEIKGFEGSVAVSETGRVLSCGDGIARIYGLRNAAAGELLEFPHSVFGMVLNLEDDNVGAALFGDPQAIGEGDEVKRTGRIAEVPVGEALLGVRHR